MKEAQSLNTQGKPINEIETGAKQNETQETEMKQWLCLKFTIPHITPLI